MLQKHIPEDKKAILELFTGLEMILCFLKRTSGATVTHLSRNILKDTSESIIGTEDLMYHLIEDESLECWPDW
ncbi:11757_t:CDS:2, partial [Dentiscutata erythropus]